MDNRYNGTRRFDISIEFSKFSKKFYNVPQPSISNIEGAKILMVEQDDQTYTCFNFDHIEYYTVRSAGEKR